MTTEHATHFEFTPGRLPRRWTEGSFSGNGLLGLVNFADAASLGYHWKDRPGENEPISGIRFDLGRADIIERGNERSKPRWDAPNRVPVGKLIIPWQGDEADGRIWVDAEQGCILGKLASGISWTAMAHAKRRVFLIRLEADSRLEDLRIEMATPIRRSWGCPDPTRVKMDENVSLDPPVAWDWSEPEAQQTRVPGEHLCTRKLADGGEVAVALVKVLASDAALWIIAIGTDSRNRADALTDSDYGDDAASEALTHLRAAAKEDWTSLLEDHIRWWSEFNHRSSVEIPDQALSAFYRLQLYRQGCAMRSDGPLVDELGPFSCDTAYPCHWWNLNIQDLHSSHLAANRAELSQPLLRTLERNWQAHGPLPTEGAGIRTVTSYRFDFSSRTPEQPAGLYALPSTANCLWLCQPVFEHWRHTGDPGVLEMLIPMLEKLLETYRIEGRVEEDGQGVAHLLHCSSPEYPAANHEDVGRDSNYELALFRWGTAALTDAAAAIGVTSAVANWAEAICRKLAGYPADANGFRVSEEQTFAVAHRHFSHLMMVYPLRLPLTQAERETAKRSLAWWLGDEIPPDRKGASGFTYTYGACMAIALGEKGWLEYCLHRLLEDAPSGRGFSRARLWPNGAYSELGPTYETPMGILRVVHEMLIQCGRDGVRLFPGVLPGWDEVAFANLVVPGGFRISARLSGGSLREVRVEAARAGELTLCFADFSLLSAEWPVRCQIAEDTCNLYMEAGETCILRR